jgi:endogenous inhibitor of DNA gyrase (YacG/DUF329 family)
MSIRSQCPVCRKPTVAEFRPFCSHGCRDRDLVNWLDEGYRMPARPDEDEEMSQQAPERDEP